MKNLFLVVIISFGIVYYYLYKNHWSKVTSYGYTPTEQIEEFPDSGTLKEENKLTKSKEILADSIRPEIISTSAL
jgi:hypothetical protein